MKLGLKWIPILMAAGALAWTAPQVLAVGPHGKSPASNSPAVQAQQDGCSYGGPGMARNFQDQDGDGICDYAKDCDGCPRRDRVRDGSCQEEATGQARKGKGGKGDGDRIRKKDGSCQQSTMAPMASDKGKGGKGDGDRIRKKDGSCQESTDLMPVAGSNNGNGKKDCIRKKDGTCKESVAAARNRKGGGDRQKKRDGSCAA
jgi:hypothetical protein